MFNWISLKYEKAPRKWKMLVIGLLTWPSFIFIGLLLSDFVEEIPMFENIITTVIYGMSFETIVLMINIFLIDSDYHRYKRLNTAEVSKLNFINKLKLSLKLNAKWLKQALVVLIISLMFSVVVIYAAVYLIGIVVVIGIIYAFIHLDMPRIFYDEDEDDW